MQDYTTEWLRIIVQNFLLEQNGELVVFGDPKQNLYNRPLDKTLENTLNFQVFKYIDMRSDCSLEVLIGNIINIISNNNNEPRDFVILASSTKLLRCIDFNYRRQTKAKTEITFVSTEILEKLKTVHNVTDERTANWKFHRDFEALERTRKQLFTTDKRCLKISTIQSFKGWESPSVIIILENDTILDETNYQPMSPQAIYTAITRARENMYIINIGNNSYHNFFYNQSL